MDPSCSRSDAAATAAAVPGLRLPPARRADDRLSKVSASLSKRNRQIIKKKTRRKEPGTVSNTTESGKTMSTASANKTIIISTKNLG